MAIFVGLNKEIAAILTLGDVNLIFEYFHSINLTACHVSGNDWNQFHRLSRFFCSTNMAAMTSSASDPYSEKKKKHNKTKQKKTVPQSL